MSRKLPKIISQEEFEQIFSAAERMEKRSKASRIKKNIKQYRIAMLLGFEAGMRISEIVGLKKLKSRCCNVDLDSRKELNKRGNKITIYFCSRCGKDLTIKEMYRTKKDEWAIQKLSKEQIESASIRIIQGKGKKDAIIPRPKRLNEAAISLLPLTIGRRALQKFVKKLGRKTLGKEITFHTLRHGYGTHLIDSGVPMHEVQMLLRHARLDTVGIYLHANPKKAIEKAREVF